MPDNGLGGHMNKLDILKSLSLGNSVAEQEADSLQHYFFETDQWQKILSGEVDIIYGQKGAGKSALFSFLSSKEKEYEFISRSILLISASNMRGESVFSALQYDPPPTESSFIYLWKIYILALIASKLKDYQLHDKNGDKLISAMEEAGLIPRSFNIETMFKSALEWILDRVKRKPSSVENTITFDSSGVPIYIRKSHYTDQNQKSDSSDIGMPINDLFSIANSVLEANDLNTWVLFDRLDVAFNETAELEKNALRALFKVYLDLFAYNKIQLKIFVRDDIWNKITADGFREASHIVRKTTINWNTDGLLNLIMRRILNNNLVTEFLSIDKNSVISDIKLQNSTFYRIMPEKVDTGKNPQTFDWIVTRISDGLKISTPRDLITFFKELVAAQIKRIEQGSTAPEGDKLFDRSIFKHALSVVSKIRYEQTLLSEYPEYKNYFEVLKSKHVEHNIETLSNLWKDLTEEKNIRVIADKLVEIGFFERRDGKQGISYWTPFLYRDALSMIQRKAFSSKNVSTRE